MLSYFKCVQQCDSRVLTLHHYSLQVFDTFNCHILLLWDEGGRAYIRIIGGGGVSYVYIHLKVLNLKISERNREKYNLIT